MLYLSNLPAPAQAVERHNIALVSPTSSSHQIASPTTSSHQIAPIFADSTSSHLFCSLSSPLPLLVPLDPLLCLKSNIQQQSWLYDSPFEVPSSTAPPFPPAQQNVARSHIKF